jgi:NAD(P)-dependent dehydrogenase (short-subunit alcohol dehydrogenase family)
MNRLSGKVALVTASTKGIGAGIAVQFAREGASVVVSGRSQDLGEALAEQIRADGGSAVFVRMDASCEEDVDAAVERAESEFGGLHILVNNAGPVEQIATGKDVPIVDLKTEDFDEAMKVGIYSAVFACRAAIPVMLRSVGGSIVNISSMAGVAGIAGLPAYACAKGALCALTRQVAVDYGKAGIRSNAIIVGPVATGTVGQMLAVPQVKAAMEAQMLTRSGVADDVAAVATFLASDECPTVTGIMLPADSGLTSMIQSPDISAAFAEAAEAAAPVA